ncbi:MAG: isoamylase early set domain-containing protein [Nitrospiraceae bacterium]|nr:isoamylase early set domain-containing protein [Nitrospiraceae bacterium]
MKKTTEKRQHSEEYRKESGEEVAVAEGLKKNYGKNRQTCKVTFFLPEEAAPEAGKIAVVGDFNDWDRNADIMSKQKDGSFSLTLELPSNREYRFKYLIDDTQWENDWCADKYIKNEFGGEDSVIQV